MASIGLVSSAAWTATSAAFWIAATPWSAAVAGSARLASRLSVGRDERVEQRLVAEVRCAAALHDPVDRRTEHRDEVRRGELRLVAGGGAGPQEGRAPDRAADAADLAARCEADLLEDRADARLVNVS